jgi:hypothetical protein
MLWFLDKVQARYRYPGLSAQVIRESGAPPISDLRWRETFPSHPPLFFRRQEAHHNLLKFLAL